MKILIFGGTRFIGSQLVKNLAGDGHEVTVVSRRMGIPQPNLNYLQGERLDVVKHLDTSVRYDVIVDFIAYQADIVMEITNKFPSSRYVLISTCWASQFEQAANSKLSNWEHSPVVKQFTDIELSYVQGKLAAESIVEKIFVKNKLACAVRLPITLGAEDHTNRLDFYRTRVLDGHPFILVNGAENLMQLAWRDDVAHALKLLIVRNTHPETAIFDALPSELVRLKDFIAMLAECEGTPFNGVDITGSVLEAAFPDFLNKEPFWREVPFPRHNMNLFECLDFSPKGCKHWLNEICKSESTFNRSDNKNKIDEFREREIKFVSHYA